MNLTNRFRTAVNLIAQEDSPPAIPTTASRLLLYPIQPPCLLSSESYFYHISVSLFSNKILPVTFVLPTLPPKMPLCNVGWLCRFAFMTFSPPSLSHTMWTPHHSLPPSPKDSCGITGDATYLGGQLDQHTRLHCLLKSPEKSELRLTVQVPRSSRAVIMQAQSMLPPSKVNSTAVSCTSTCTSRLRLSKKAFLKSVFASALGSTNLKR